ncbi:MAG: CapA family protein, partial [Firmicutes bacterium]|nr:CapA family protein [Bacillota bacterium]
MKQEVSRLLGGGSTTLDMSDISIFRDILFIELRRNILKRSYNYIFNLGLVMLLILALAACSLESVNPNRNNETQGVSSPEHSGRTPEETGSSTANDPIETADEVTDETASPISSMPEEPKGSTSIKIRAVGDIMMHSPQIPAGQKEDGTFDFRYFFEEVKPYLEDSDITIGNFECTIGDGSIGYSGYPLFRSPGELAEALKYAGFDILTTANNHSFDGREFGVGYTLDQLDANGILHTGTARSMEERNDILIIEEKGVKVAVVAYTYGTNGMEAAISADKLPYMVNYIDKDMISRDVAQAKEAGADLII